MFNYIIIGLLLLLIFVDIIRIFVGKTNVLNEIDSIKVSILSILPDLIAGVEAPGDGDQKKIMVLKLVHLFLEKTYGLKDSTQLDSFISDAIESILKTPTKKEV